MKHLNKLPIVLFIAAVIFIVYLKDKPRKYNGKPVMVEAKLKVEGMHCDNCEATIAKGVNQLAGIDSISANHEDSTAFVRFDSNQTDLAEISKTIEEYGFHVAAAKSEQ